MQLGKQLGQVAGRDLSNDSAQRVGVALHRTLGMSYGMAASLLVGRGVRPLWAGLVMGLAAFALVDEGTSISTFSDYPMESHMRGVVGHSTYGLAAGLLLSLVERSWGAAEKAFAGRHRTRLRSQGSGGGRAVTITILSWGTMWR